MFFLECASGSSDRTRRREEVDGFEIEESEVMLPDLWRLDRGEECWVFLHEVETLIGEVPVKDLPRIRLLSSEIEARAQCLTLRAPPLTPSLPSSTEVTLLLYTPRLKELLGVETTTIPS